MNLSAPAINRVKELDIVLTKNNAQISSRPGMRRMRRGETFGWLQLWLRTQEYVVHVAYKFGIWLQERRKRDATSGTLDKDRAEDLLALSMEKISRRGRAGGSERDVFGCVPDERGMLFDQKYTFLLELGLFVQVDAKKMNCGLRFIF